jgi:hypothetical protein
MNIRSPRSFVRPKTEKKADLRATSVHFCTQEQEIRARLTPTGGGAETRLLSTTSIQEVFKGTIGDFERESGHKAIIHYGTMGAITDWMRGSEEADALFLHLKPRRRGWHPHRARHSRAWHGGTA